MMFHFFYRVLRALVTTTVMEALDTSVRLADQHRTAGIRAISCLASTAQNGRGSATRHTELPGEITHTETGGKGAHGNRDGLRGALASSTIRSRYRITDESSPVVFNAPQTIRHVVKFTTHSRESALSPPLLIP